MVGWTVSSEPPIEEMQARLWGLHEKLQKRGLRLGLSASVRPMTKRMRRGAPVYTRALKKAIGFRTLSKRSLRNLGSAATKFDFGFEVGVIKKVADPKRKGKRIDQAFKAYWIEYGVEPHSTAKGARRDKGRLQHRTPYHPGFARKQFVNPAIEAESPQFGPRFAKAIDQFLAEL